MIFTREDILKILNALLQLGRKDSEFKDANTPLNSDDYIAILLDGINKKVSINNFLSTLGLLRKDDFINVSDRYDEYYIQLSEAITIIANNKRKKGLVITFQDVNGSWRIYQFNDEIVNFIKTEYWKDLSDFKYPIINTVLPDEEDLTLTYPNTEGNSFIKLKDKEYNPEDFSGMATKILRKHIIEIDDPELGKVKKNILYQDDFNQENCIYEIRYNFDLDNNVTIPNGCILKFNGGVINSTLYAIHFNNTYILAPNNIVIFNAPVLGKIKNDIIYAYWFGCYYKDNSESLLRNIFNIIKDGTKIIFNKTIQLSVLFSTQNAISIAHNNITVEGLNIKLINTKPLFFINGKDNANPINNVSIENCIFKSEDTESIMLIYLGSVNNVNVFNNIFEHVGYCVILHAGLVSNNVKISYNTATNLTLDFIEANCTNTAPSHNWIITHNIYEGNINYPDWDNVECRFIGITAVNGIIIDNNIASKSSADAMIHLEDIGGDIIVSNNYFKDAVGLFIWCLSNTYKSMLVTNNIFKITDINCCGKGSYEDPSMAPYFLTNTASTFIDVKAVIENNIFEGINNENNYFGRIAFFPAILKNNKFKNIHSVNVRTTENNIFEDCYMCFHNTTVSDVIYRNNIDTNTVYRSIYLKAIAGEARRNPNPIFENNIISNTVMILDADNLVFRNNIINNNAPVYYNYNINAPVPTIKDYSNNCLSTKLCKEISILKSNINTNADLVLLDNCLTYKFNNDDNYYPSNAPVISDKNPKNLGTASLWFNSKVNKLAICTLLGKKDTYLLNISGTALSDGKIKFSYKDTECTINIKKDSNAYMILDLINLYFNLPEWYYNRAMRIISRIAFNFDATQLYLDNNEAPEGIDISLTYITVGTPNTWKDIFGFTLGNKSGDSSARPTLTNSDINYQFYDTTLNKPIWWNGTNWVDATGLVV